jgi:hypothetical protein
MQAPTQPGSPSGLLVQLRTLPNLHKVRFNLPSKQSVRR